MLKDRFLRIEKVNFSKLKQFQGDLKFLTSKNYERLKSAIKMNGIMPFFIDEKYNILDGHQRYLVIKNMIEKKELPNDVEINCNVLKVENEKDAKSLILYISSHYGQINETSFSDYMIENDLDPHLLENIEIPEIKSLEIDQNEESKIDKIQDEYLLIVTLENKEDQGVLYKELKDRNLKIKLI